MLLAYPEHFLVLHLLAVQELELLLLLAVHKVVLADGLPEDLRQLVPVLPYLADGGYAGLVLLPVVAGSGVLGEPRHGLSSLVDELLVLGPDLLPVRQLLEMGSHWQQR